MDANFNRYGLPEKQRNLLTLKEKLARSSRKCAWKLAAGFVDAFKPVATLLDAFTIFIPITLTSATLIQLTFLCQKSIHVALGSPTFASTYTAILISSIALKTLQIALDKNHD